MTQDKNSLPYLRRKLLKLDSLFTRRLAGITEYGFADYLTDQQINQMPSIVVECGMLFYRITHRNTSAVLELLANKERLVYHSWVRNANGELQHAYRFARGFAEWCMLCQRNDL